MVEVGPRFQLCLTVALLALLDKLARFLDTVLLGQVTHTHGVTLAEQADKGVTHVLIVVHLLHALGQLFPYLMHHGTKGLAAFLAAGDKATDTLDVLLLQTELTLQADNPAAAGGVGLVFPQHRLRTYQRRYPLFQRLWLGAVQDVHCIAVILQLFLRLG